MIYASIIYKRTKSDSGLTCATVETRNHATLTDAQMTAHDAVNEDADVYGAAAISDDGRGIQRVMYCDMTHHEAITLHKLCERGGYPSAQ
jgi:hypothetical protein